MMKKDPKIFADVSAALMMREGNRADGQYHMTHRALTSAWPSPPLPHIVELLQPLPPKTLIVDLGCGDAGLARALVPQGKIVLSYDLVGDSGVPSGGSSSSSGEGWVVEADFLDHVPLPGRRGGSSTSDGQAGAAGDAPKKSKKGKGRASAAASEVVDAVVCCLSLMGVNWVGGIYEACRILKKGCVSTTIACECALTRSEAHFTSRKSRPASSVYRPSSGRSSRSGSSWRSSRRLQPTSPCSSSQRRATCPRDPSRGRPDGSHG